jgi:hypothetical protein
MNVEWFVPRVKPNLEWFGQTQDTLAAIEKNGRLAVASVIGPAGPKGDPGDKESVTAAEPLGGHRAVTADGLHATPQTLDRLVGITLGAGQLGAAVQYVSRGLMAEASWAWQAGAPVFVGLAGVLTQTPPASGPARRVAWALSATEINVDLHPIIQLSS